jgi:RimJ/RimL family protein N-acetyltransferase
MQQQNHMDKRITTPHGLITIRPAQEADAQAYRDLRLEALRNHPEAFSADYAASEEQPMAYWTERLRSLGSDSMMVFAVVNDSLIGMCGIYRGNSPKTQHSATLVSVYVQPAWRGCRIAEGLITSCVEWARAQEIRVVKLAVVTTNTAAIRCYARSDFTVYGIEPQALYHAGVMVDELLMARLI